MPKKSDLRKSPGPRQQLSAALSGALGWTLITPRPEMLEWLGKNPTAGGFYASLSVVLTGDLKHSARQSTKDSPWWEENIKISQTSRCRLTLGVATCFTQVYTGKVLYRIFVCSLRTFLSAYAEPKPVLEELNSCRRQ